MKKVNQVVLRALISPEEIVSKKAQKFILGGSGYQGEDCNGVWCDYKRENKNWHICCEHSQSECEEACTRISDDNKCSCS